MLGKLIKYEFRATARHYLPIYGLILLLTLFGGITGSKLGAVSLEEGRGFWMAVLIAAYGAAVFALMVLTLVITVNRFYKNLLGSEGYLMFTLPVTTGRQIFGKLLPALAWIILSCLVVLFSALLLITKSSAADLFGQIFPAIGEACRELGVGNFLLGAVELIALGLLGTASLLLTIYLALAIGQLANEHKFLLSFGAFVAIQTLGQTLGLVVAFAGGNHSLAWLYALISGLPGSAAVHVSLLGLILGGFIICAALYAPTWFLLHKKLNLA